ncbi:MAG: class I SAM-dependent methyltransferase [Comamonadaceae bacterium]|nr:class I SAM-dependent methyltransferase [Comamonadaceae bacterium]
MQASEFDKFAQEYQQSLRQSIRLSGESPEFFAAYKVRDALACARGLGLAPSRVLDFGCGVGGSIPFFHDLAPGARLQGVDVSLKSLELARERFGAMAAFQACDEDRLPFEDAAFDLIFTACVFHHIPPAMRPGWLREIRRVLAPGGVFVAFEHNPLNPLTVRVVKNCPFDENAQLLTAGEFGGLLRQAGFADVKARYRIFFPHALRALRPLERGLRWCPLGAQYFLAARA